MFNLSRVDVDGFEGWKGTDLLIGMSPLIRRFPDRVDVLSKVVQGCPGVYATTLLR